MTKVHEKEEVDLFIELQITYQDLATVTNAFTDTGTLVNCVRVTQLYAQVHFISIFHQCVLYVKVLNLCDIEMSELLIINFRSTIYFYEKIRREMK
jgi:hypothetical protein